MDTSTVAEYSRCMKVHIVMHESFESPAAIERWATERNCEVGYTKLYAGDVIPEKPDCDFLVIMGGPQSPATTPAECPHFDAAREIALIRQAIDAGTTVFGVCLGAQLIGEALGARFDHSPNREIGVFPIMLTEEGKRDPLIGAFPEILHTGHWHGDMPGLTPESKVLATSEGCPRQIVRYSPKVYGFQCHLEFTLDAIEAMIENNAHELAQYAGLPYIETADTLRSHDYEEMNVMLFSFLDRLTDHAH